MKNNKLLRYIKHNVISKHLYEIAILYVDKRWLLFECSPKKRLSNLENSYGQILMWNGTGNYIMTKWYHIGDTFEAFEMFTILENAQYQEKINQIAEKTFINYKQNYNL